MAAGLGFKTFTTGEVLTAADTNGYLMQGVLVFASAAARDAAITSPQEGQFAYLKDTNVTTYYTGSAWTNLDTTGMTNPMTTTGDMVYSSSGSTPARLGIGTTGQVITVAGGIPSWATPSTGSTAVGATAFTSSTQNTTQNVYTVINLNSEAFDTDALHSTSTNTSRLTIPTGKGGYWLVNALTTIDAGGNDVFLQVFKNGSVITGYGQWDNKIATSNYGGGGYVVAWGSQTYPLSAGDYIEIAVRSAKATGANCLNMTFSAMYLGA